MAFTNIARTLAAAAALGTAAASSQPASAQIVVDQENTDAPGGAVPSFDWQQSFRPTANNITGAAMCLNFGRAGNATIRLLDGLNGTEIASGFAEGAGIIQVDFGGPIPVVPEREYVLKLEASFQWNVNTQTNPYPRGELYINGGTFASGNGDAWFRTFTDTSFVAACDSPADVTTTGTNNGVPDGQIDLSDFSAYLTLWSDSSFAADVTTTGTSNGTPDGNVDLSDFSFYITLWSAGCP